uniref:hypothetical protein n=1 Tax=Mariniflexile sp. TaxID=1979402 RepID=UPI004048409B
MKKVFLLLFVVATLIFGCSSNDDSDSKNQSSINPPSWIQGTWLLQDAGVDSGFKFTIDDVCIIFSSSQACNKEQLELANNTSLFTKVEEEITDTSYSIDISIVSSVTSYDFEKVSNNEIRWLNAGGTNAVYTKQ